MAEPNITAVTSILGKMAVLVVTTSPVAILTTATGHVSKCNSLIIANVDGTNSATVDVDIYRSSVAYSIAKTITVPADASLDVLSSHIYLQEGDALRITASGTSDLQAVLSYEDIS